MDQLTWSDQFCVNVGDLDHQHRELFAGINEVHAAVSAGGEAPSIGPLLLKLAADTRVHFAAEEAMMAANNFPGLALHCMKHQYLLEQVDAFLARYSRAGFVMNNHALNFLGEWLTTHIQREDMLFGLWLNEHGKL